MLTWNLQGRKGSAAGGGKAWTEEEVCLTAPVRYRSASLPLQCRKFICCKCVCRKLRTRRLPPTWKRPNSRAVYTTTNFHMAVTGAKGQTHYHPARLPPAQRKHPWIHPAQGHPLVSLLLAPLALFRSLHPARHPRSKGNHFSQSLQMAPLQLASNHPESQSNSDVTQEVLTGKSFKKYLRCKTRCYGEM